jgi:TPR repeat protein
MRRLPALLAAATLAALLPTLAGAEETLKQKLQQLPNRFRDEQTQVRALEARKDAESALDLGRLLKNGLAAARDNPLRQADEKAAEDAFERAIAAGGPAANDARAELADLLAAPDRPAGDMQRAIELYKTAAEGGSSGAAVALARLLEGGQAIARNLDQARALYTRALRDEEPEAAFGLARLAAAGGDSEAVNSFTAQGIMFLRLRADRSAAAASALATRYANGDGLPRDLDRARTLFQQAIGLGQTSAAISLGKDLAAGSDVPRDPAAARALLIDAETAGSVEAARLLLTDAAGPASFNLGSDEIALLVRHVEGIGDISGMLVAASLYRNGRGVASDPARSAALIGRVMASARQNPPELVRLGRMFRSGSDVPADPDRAFAFFAAAAEAGIADGAIAGAEMALDDSVKLKDVDPKKVVGWLQQAAAARVARAMVLLGDAYRRGFGVPRSDEEASRYYDMAIAGGSEASALERRAFLYLDNASGRDDGLRAVALLQRAAGQGRTQAMDVLGRQYQYGTYVAKDAILAERWFIRAGELGYLPAMIDLGELYEAADPPLGSPEKAFAAYQRAWSAGSGEAGLHLGRILKTRGQAAEARAMFQQAMGRGDSVSAIELAGLVLAEAKPGASETAAGLIDHAVELSRADSNSGLAVAEAIAALPDPTLVGRGIKLLTDLDAGGDGAATRILAELYVTAKVGPFDRATAETWARKAAVRGSAQPLFMLGAAMIRGDQMAKDVPAGVALLEEAHRNVPTHMQTAILLARQYQTGAGVKQDVARGLELLSQAAEFGSITAQVLTARAYAEGSGTARDPAKAILWFGRAADQGSLEAMMELGRYYAAGEGVKLDAERAFGFFYRAAEKGSVEAMVEVGKSMLVGYGTLQDTPLGVRWLEQAATAGSVSAMYDLFQFYNLGDAENHDAAKALRWITQAAENGSAEAAFRMALLYRDGGLVAKDESQMKVWLGRAAKAGHNYSARLLAKLEKAGKPTVIYDDDPNDTGDE